MCLQVLPSNMGTAARQLALLIDDMWHAAGDTATDYNWCACDSNAIGRFAHVINVPEDYAHAYQAM